MNATTGTITATAISRKPKTRWVKTQQTIVRTVWYEIDDTYQVDSIVHAFGHGLKRNAIHRKETVHEECISKIVDVKPKSLK
tara:strand:+ start:1053 stop:1298 length:246 start_codon:yes stop_codon:yes gene_type:complete